MVKVRVRVSVRVRVRVRIWNNEPSENQTCGITK